MRSAANPTRPTAFQFAQALPTSRPPTLSRRRAPLCGLQAPSPGSSGEVGGEALSNTPLWMHAVRAARLVTLSGALLLGWTPHPSNIAHANATAAPATSARRAPSDVEAAAMTMAAVALGGVAMRVVTAGRRDEAAERGRVEAECARLAEEERQRALRKERRKMEGGAEISQELSAGVSDDRLLLELKERMQTLETEGDEQEEQEGKGAAEKNVTGAAPSGLGSAVLERPDEDGNYGDSQEGGDDTPPEKLGNPDELDMLNRMWNLSPPDKE